MSNNNYIPKNTVLIIGAGVWGQALSCLFSTQMTVHLWMRNPNKISTIKNNLKINTDNEIIFIEDLKNLELYSLIIIATPINALRSILLMLLSHTNQLPDLFITCKGLEQTTSKLAYQIVEELANHLNNYGMLVGPSFACELIKNLPTLIALSSSNQKFIIKWINYLKIKNFKIYGHNDIIGACAASALKNIIAIAVGISFGLGLGQNSASAIISRGLHEMNKFIVALGGNKYTVYGLTGVGDLFLTCHPQSRNYQVGIKLTQNLNIDQIINNLQQTAEGVATSKAVHNKAKQLKIEMPICETVYQIIYENLNINTALEQLLNRPNKMEDYYT